MRHVRFTQAQLEAGLAVALTVGIELELALGGHLGSPTEAVAAAMITLPVAVRFRWPLLALTAGSIAAVAQMALGDRAGDPIIGIVAALLVLYAVGSRTRGWRFWTGAAISVAAGCATSVIREGVTSDLVTAVLATAAGLTIGRALGVLRLETDVLEERASELERERDERAQQAVADERSRMARELHDVIGHSISVMGVQAGAVRRVLKPEQVRERDALLAVERTGRQAVGEMRRLIGLLRTEDEGISGPSPSLKRVEQLAAEMRRAGLGVELTVEGELDRLPPGADLAAYRILQEAFTNTLKHAPGARPQRRAHALDRRPRRRAGRTLGHKRARRARAARHARASRALRRRADHRTPGQGRLRRARPDPHRGDLMAIRVVVADDQEMVRAGFLMILEAEQDIEVVGQAEDGERAIAAARRTHPDVVVMDIQMPNVDGIAATREILSSIDPAPRVLVVTTFDIDEYVYEALRVGASGFLLKNSSPEDLLRAVRTVAAGDALLSPSVTRRVIETFGRRAVRTTPPDGFDELTEREREVLLLIARGLSNNEIADELVVSGGTVKTHVARVLMKLGLRDRAQAIVLAYESGLVQPGATRGEPS